VLACAERVVAARLGRPPVSEQVGNENRHRTVAAVGGQWGSRAVPAAAAVGHSMQPHHDRPPVTDLPVGDPLTEQQHTGVVPEPVMMTSSAP
jgi:hypothetical protein